MNSHEPDPTIYDLVALRRWKFKWRLAPGTCLTLFVLVVASSYIPWIALTLPLAALLLFLWFVFKQGRMGRVFAVSVAVILATTLIVVDARTRAHDTRMEVQRASIEQMLNASLSIGDGPQQIETALKQSALSFVYMKDQQRYHASVGTDDPNTWVEATIAVSAEQRVIDVSVRTRFVSL